MFHSEEGLYFERNPDGSVTITKAKNPLAGVDCPCNVLFKQTIPEGIWCSIMCSISLAGEEGLRWFKAKTFHSEPVESFSPE